MSDQRGTAGGGETGVKNEGGARETQQSLQAEVEAFLKSRGFISCGRRAESWTEKDWQAEPLSKRGSWSEEPFVWQLARLAS